MHGGKAWVQRAYSVALNGCGTALYLCCWKSALGPTFKTFTCLFVVFFVFPILVCIHYVLSQAAQQIRDAEAAAKAVQQIRDAEAAAQAAQQIRDAEAAAQAAQQIRDAAAASHALQRQTQEAEAAKLAATSRQKAATAAKDVQRRQRVEAAAQDALRRQVAEAAVLDVEERQRRQDADEAPWILPPLRPGQRESSRDADHRRGCEAVLRGMRARRRQAEATARAAAAKIGGR